MEQVFFFLGVIGQFFLLPRYARKGAGEIIVSVIDTGSGISPEALEYVFEKFKQVGKDDGTVQKGTGLGLPICKQIIEKHGGRIWAESEPGKGSTFSFSLPVVKVGGQQSSEPEVQGGLL